MEIDSVLPSSGSTFYTLYDHLTLHIIPGPRSLSYFIGPLLLPSALSIPPTVVPRRQLGYIFLPLIVACEIHAWQSSGVLDVISTTVLQWSFVLLVCYDPRANFKRVWWEDTQVSVGRREAQKPMLVERVQVYPGPLIQRISWALALVVSIRLTGWRIGEDSHDKWQPNPRIASSFGFLRRALRTMLLSYLLLDISGCYTRMDSYFTIAKTKIDAPYSDKVASAAMSAFVQSILRHFPPRLVRSSILASQSYGFIAGGYYPATIPIVGLRALGLVSEEWSPHTWPPFFGPFSAVRKRGLRGLWGSWWHQMNRQINATPGRVLADHVGFKNDSIPRKTIITTIAFGLSGWMHMGMIPPDPISTNMTPHQMRWNVAAFFWIQPIGFVVEFLVTTVIKQTAPGLMSPALSSFVVLVWVSAWLCFTLPLLTAPFRELGYWTVYPVPFSVLSGVAGNGWSTWKL